MIDRLVELFMYTGSLCLSFFFHIFRPHTPIHAILEKSKETIFFLVNSIIYR